MAVGVAGADVNAAAACDSTLSRAAHTVLVAKLQQELQVLEHVARVRHHKVVEPNLEDLVRHVRVVEVQELHPR